MSHSKINKTSHMYNSLNFYQDRIDICSEIVEGNSNKG